MYLECWCAGLGILWLLSLMVTLPLSQEKGVGEGNHVLSVLSKPSLLPRLTEQTQNKQRLVLQANLETRR